MLNFNEDKQNHKIWCDGSEAKTLGVLRQLLGKENSDSQDRHEWFFSSDKSYEDAHKKIDDYEKEHNNDLEYAAESIIIKQDLKIPGTNILLEAGDKINLFSKMIEDTNVSTDDFDSKYPVKWSDTPMYQSKSFVFYEGFNGLDHYHKTVTKPGTDAFKYGVKVCLPDWHNDDIYVIWNGYDKKNGSVNPFRLVDCINEALKFAKQISGYMRVDVRYI